MTSQGAEHSFVTAFFIDFKQTWIMKWYFQWMIIFSCIHSYETQIKVNIGNKDDFSSVKESKFGK